MATWHEVSDPLLAMPIEVLASTVSNFVRTSNTPGCLASDTAAAIRAAKSPAECGAPRVATLVVPHDLAWSEILTGSPVGPDQKVVQIGSTPHAASPSDRHMFLAACAAAIKAEPRGKAALYVGGSAVLKQGTHLLYQCEGWHILPCASHED